MIRYLKSTLYKLVIMQTSKFIEFIPYKGVGIEDDANNNNSISAYRFNYVGVKIQKLRDKRKKRITLLLSIDVKLLIKCDLEYEVIRILLRK